MCRDPRPRRSCRSIQPPDINQCLENNETVIPCIAHKYTYDDENHFYDPFHSEYNNTEIWELTFIFGDDFLSIVSTYFVDVKTLEPFQFIITTN